MTFLRVVEVFPPRFPVSQKDGSINTEEKIERFVEDVRSIRDLADVFLVANLKNPELVKMSTIEASFLLHDRLRVEAAPVIVVRDYNRPQFLSTVFSGIALELRSMMIAWGDRYPAKSQVTNVKDFSSLSQAIKEVASIRRRAHASTRIFSPVDLNRLSGPKGIAFAKDRLTSGADYLLAQPPTTDSGETFTTHATLLEKAGLKDRVLLNVFPFKDREDAENIEKIFGWKLPSSLHQSAASGEEALVHVERKVVQRLRQEHFPGVYLTTRGIVGNAEKLLS